MDGTQAVFSPQLRQQRGVSLTGLIFLLAILSVLFLFAAKIFPTVLEYRAIKNSIAAAKATNGTPAEMRNAFDKNADINTIKVISSKDLIISKDSGETEISFDYESRIPLFSNVTLLIEYSGTTDKSGIVPAKPEAPR
jgi:hypothetical protein